MNGNCIFHDGEAKAGAAEFARATLVGAVEALKEVIEVLRFYARTVVADGELVEMAAFMLYGCAGDTQK